MGSSDPRWLLLAAALCAGALPAIAAPLPTPRPETVETAPRVGLDAAFAAIDARDLEAALTAAEALDPVERDLVLWLAIRRNLDGLNPRQILDFSNRRPHWPTTTLMRQRAEQALVRAGLPAGVLLAAMGTSAPKTPEGVLAKTRALVETGRTGEAEELLVSWWAPEKLSPGEDAAILKEFGDIIGMSSLKARYDHLMYADRVAQARAIAKRIGPDFEGLADARAAMLRDAGNAGRLIDGVSGEARKDPLFAFTLAEWQRRADRGEEAAATLMTVPGDQTVAHGDAWWVERRIVSRGLIEDGDPGTAYKLVADHRGGDSETMAEANFHAGWYALRFLKDPARAEPHFLALQRSVSLPISRARAAYWLGRTAEAAGRRQDAARHYQVAAADEFTFYGQLARVKLGMTSLGLPPEPEPTDADRAAFAENDLVRALMLLTTANRDGDAAVLYPEIARLLPSGGQLALLARHAAGRSNHRAALQVGKVAADRNLGAERLAFPLDAIPETGRSQTWVETAMVYAIARQESAFDPGAVSSAGAMGLLQLLPSTAEATARSIGIAFSKGKLTTDADYNATLGAAHLRELVDEFDGSYILTFAAYNAGKRRAYQWIQRFGDPRQPGVDPVDWIELIPFGETRNYVQRVTENLQVYRERLDESPLGIAADLKRGS